MKFVKKSKTSPVMSRREALKCIPVINTSVHYTETEKGEVLLEYPLQIKPFLKSIFARFQKEQITPTKKLQLDEMGSKVWKQIDGVNNVEDIITDFSQQYGITIQESEQSVTAFLVQLGKRGIIAMS